MKVLVLVSATPHSHDYGVDYLIDGLREVCGAENVYDWPEKPCLHLQPGQARDSCNIDSDAWWPSNGDLDIGWLVKLCDLAIIACQPDDHEGTSRIRRVLGLWPLSKPIACADMTDHVRDYRGFYDEVARRPVVYFKRELPIGETWGHPLPLCYPASKVPKLDFAAKSSRICYHATSHGDSGPGLPRIEIVKRLRELVPVEQLDVGLYVSQEKGTRPDPEELHVRMAQSLVGISWNGAPYLLTQDANRTHENFAFGLAQVMERPRIKFMDRLVDGEYAVFADSYEQVAQLAADLLHDEAWAHMVAYAGHKWFLANDTSAVRAKYLLDVMAAVG